MTAIVRSWRLLLAGVVAACLWHAARADPPAISASLVPAPGGRTNHGPGLVGLADGGLLLCWYSGATEANEDARILCSDSADHGGHWTPPRVAVDRGEQAPGAAAANKSLGNVTLHRASDGRLWMIYGVIQRWDWPLVGNVCRNWLCGRVDAKVSSDQGRTWSGAMRLDDQTGALPRGKPVRVAGLGDVIPLYLEGAEQSFVRIVDLARASPEHPPLGPTAALSGAPLIQPSLVVQADGRLRAFLRDSRAVSIYTAVFDPATLRWGAAVATNLPNPGAAVEALRDDKGRFVLIYNPSRDDRRTLSLAWSDDGISFHRGCDLVGTGTQGDVAYPTAIRDDDGDWHVVYSSDGKSRIRHLRFGAAWLDQCLGG